MSTSPLRVAVPNKGSLSESAFRLLTDAGYLVYRGSGRELQCNDPENNMTFFFQRPRDIAVYVGSGALDVGITGLDLLVDSAAPAREALRLGFARSRFHFAARPDGPQQLADLAGLSVATSYPTLVGKYLADVGVSVSLVKLDGAVENAISLGLADAIADVVETGTSLQNCGLVTFGDSLMESEAVLIRSETSRQSSRAAEAIDALVERLEGVLTARRYVMVEYDCPSEALDAACALTPGIEGPTVSPLARAGWVAVRAMVKRAGVQRTMDDLKRVGARASLVIPLEACRM
ncbi:ATP phosphoribosyltransferase [Micromonospora sp. NPDC005324]|uniref:ATP phosphoribosyltransferase n=1 Tax=Micromonospora sp. NPDC005324 TaxID=3157033 RepID=UPI0033A93891